MPKVTFQNTGQSVEVKKGEKLEKVTKDNGWPIPYGCENGICGTCLITIPSGEKNLNPLSDQEKQTLTAMGKNDGKHRLACQCKVEGDVTLEQ